MPRFNGQSRPNPRENALMRNDARQAPRLALPPMYTLVRVRPRGEERFCWTGHIYDISASGMRFELDEPLPAGTEIEVRAMLPGYPHTTFNAAGHVVRRHDDPEDLGPARMGMSFDAFSHGGDRRRLEDYLQHASRKAA
jgi:hypothetical protein